MNSQICPECVKQADNLLPGRSRIYYETCLISVLMHCNHVPSKSPNKTLDKSVADSKSSTIDLTKTA